MYKVVALLRRKADLTHSEFKDYYETRHVPLIERLTPPMLAYRRSYVDLSAPYKRDEEQIDFDVITEMEFEDEAACSRWFEAFGEPRVLNEVLADELKFLDAASVRVCAVAVERSS